ncbi:hypothetical protein AVEN_157083-1 [Araneus ventricosus]|uniref:Uncharacterized protein n=1 Tax=Araneus ventricosus TaxID=182803 RepID=A0A4Y2LJH5_ARAVE|nr:hypothetical protein AVEN_227043-1 [Araneus ventricosus]GBN14705.1 hypothetical protein AVEN_237145-1 [Araneus ventricosus]GBN14714.1 hypothetical protein AVEN_9328-1 [Araneus ventricosus]GBN14743.1 hypothetical protein AVEN_157083-1 [Araneus ventricosus]
MPSLLGEFRWQRCPSGSGAAGFLVRNPIPLKIRRVLGLLNVKSYVGGQTPSRWYGARLPTLARATQEGRKAGGGPASEESPHQHVGGRDLLGRIK